MNAPTTTRSSLEDLTRDLALLDANGELTAARLESYVDHQDYSDAIPPWLRWAARNPERFLQVIEDVTSFVERHADKPALAEFYKQSVLAQLVPRQQRRAVLSRLLSAFPPPNNAWVEVLYDAGYSSDNITAIIGDAIGFDVDTITPRHAKSFTANCFITHALQPTSPGRQNLWQILGAQKVMQLLETVADHLPWLIIGGIKSNTDQFLFDKVVQYFKSQDSRIDAIAIANNLYVSAALNLKSSAGVNFYEVRRLPKDLREMMLERFSEPWLELLVNTVLDLKSAEGVVVLERFGHWFEAADPCSCFLAYYTTLKNSTHRLAATILRLLEDQMKLRGYVIGNPKGVHLNSATVFQIRVNGFTYQHFTPHWQAIGMRPIYTVVFHPDDAKMHTRNETVVHLVEFKVVNPELAKVKPYPAPRQ